MSPRFYHMYCPKDVVSRYQLLVFDTQHQPFLPLTDFYHDCSVRISKSSALSYLKNLLPFFTWLDMYSNYEGNPVRWHDTPSAIRVAIEDYLMDEMACKVREKDSFHFVNRTHKSPNTVNRFLSALKSFYKLMIQLHHYSYLNPLIDTKSVMYDYRNQTEGVRTGKPRMPNIAGTEDPLPHRRLTDSYFKLVNEEWQPKILDDPHLPYKVYQAGKQVNWSLRETVIARLLFETGARASEVIEVTIGDYRRRKSFQELSTFTKGSYGRRIKFLRFSKDTVKLLLRYINTERKSVDDLNRHFETLPDEAPLFLTGVGTPFTYAAWYYHWNKAMKKNQLKINPHKTRHWFVTTRLHEIYNISMTETEIAKRKNELIKYMKWKQQATINVYEHYFDEEKCREAHDKMLESMAKKEKEYLHHKEKKVEKRNDNLGKMTISIELDKDIQALFNGLE
ncbi:site-specific integrase [Priestia aryabhattai]|nr:site-specific integrase [Priestia megaterium]AUO14576.1 site-specific integrase [Priestia megaterium]MBU3570732.1 site-specific integrase [Priestia aryabhattai]PAK42166.1 integrase [Priestia megaterium]